MSEVIKEIVVDGEAAARIWAAVDYARARFPECFAGMNDSEALDELLRLAQDEEATA